MKYINEENLKNTSFVNKDFQALWTELLELVPKLTNKWDPSQANESDPLVVLLKLCAIVADKTNYNIDKNILELYPLSLTQLRTAYGVYDTLGYNPKWYISAIANLTVAYNGAYSTADLSGAADYVTLKQFTALCDDDATVVYTTLNDVRIDKSKPGIYTVDAIEGTLNDLLVNGTARLTVDNMDSHNRIYFPQTNIAQNGVFVSSSETDFDAASTSLWKQVEELYQQPLHTKCFMFGVDPITGSVYLEFPSDIGALIGSGIYIKYITSSGESGNIKANTISRFLYDSERLGNVTAEVEYSIGKGIDEIIAVNNAVAVKNGYNPESIEEMYYNYKKTANLLNTLVTLLDYHNYITTCTDKSSRKIVSNVQVSDRTNDLYCSVPVQTLSINGESYSKVVTFDDCHRDVPESINAFHLRFYPTDYQEVTSKESYNKTFACENLEATQETIESFISDVKAINHDFLAPRNPIVIPYSLTAEIYLQNKVSNADAVHIKENVLNALRQSFNASKLSFGTAPDYSELLTVMETADTRIKHVALSPPNYNIDTNNFLNDYNNYITKGHPTSMKYDVIERSILAGVTPFTQFDNTYSADYNQKELSTVGAGNNTVTVTSINIDTIKANINGSTTSVDIELSASDTLTIDLSSELTSEDKNIKVEDIVNKLKIDEDNTVLHATNIKEINSGVMLNDKHSEQYAPMFEVKQNEDISLFAPKYNVKNTYANFMYFFCESSTPFELKVNTPYRLKYGECIHIFETKTEALNAIKGVQRAKASYTIRGTNDESSPIVKITDREGRYSAFNFRTSSWSSETDLYNMNTYISVEELELASGTLAAANGETTLLMCTNSIQLRDALASGTEYTLRTGEYLLYSDMNGMEIGIISEGSTLSTIKGHNVTDLYVLPSTSLEDALDGDIGTVSASSWTTVPENVVKYTLNTILTLGEGYQLEYKCVLDGSSQTGEGYFSNWTGDGTAFEVKTGMANIHAGELLPDRVFIVKTNEAGTVIEGYQLQVTYEATRVTRKYDILEKHVDENGETSWNAITYDFTSEGLEDKTYRVVERDAEGTIQLHYEFCIVNAMSESELLKFKVTSAENEYIDIHFAEFDAENDAPYYYMDAAGKIYQDCEAEVLLHYKLKGDTDWTAVDPTLEDEGWKGIIRLHLDMVESPQQLIFDSGLNNNKIEEVSHNQFLALKRGVIDIEGNHVDDCYLTHTIAADTSQDNVYVDSNLIIRSSGGSGLVLTDSESNSCTVTRFDAQSVAKSNAVFREFTALQDSSGKVTLPGTPIQFVIIPVRFGENTSVSYYLCKGATELTATLDGKTISYLGIPQLIREDASIYHNRVKTDVATILGDNAFVFLSEAYIYNSYFNPTYQVPDNELIADPTEPSTYFSEKHPFNRYCLAKFDEDASSTSIQISKLSIQ